jgi:hypothetical protein
LQERVFHLELAVKPFQFAQPGPLGYLQRRFLFCMLFPVGANPVTQRRLGDLKFPGHVSDRTRGIDDQPDRFLLELG